MFYNNGDTFDNQIPIWKILLDIPVNIRRWPIASSSDMWHIDHVLDHCTLHSLGNIFHKCLYHCNICCEMKWHPMTHHREESVSKKYIK